MIAQRATKQKKHEEVRRKGQMGIRERVNSEERRRQWRQLYDRNRRQIPEIRERRHEYTRQWRERNREKYIEMSREYDKRRAEIRNASTPCECGGRFAIRHQARHVNSQRHQNWLAQQQSQDTPVN